MVQVTVPFLFYFDEIWKEGGRAIKHGFLTFLLKLVKIKVLEPLLLHFSDFIKKNGPFPTTFVSYYSPSDEVIFFVFFDWYTLPLKANLPGQHFIYQITIKVKVTNNNYNSGTDSNYFVS